jgi:hypothetical protein
MGGKAQKPHATRSELNSVFGLEKVDQWNPIRTSPYSPDLAPCDFWGFTSMKRELRGKKFRSDQRSAARFRELGGALLRSASLDKGGTSKERDRHRTSTNFRLGVIR